MLRPSGANVTGSTRIHITVTQGRQERARERGQIQSASTYRIYGVDYFTTFSPIAKLASFQVSVTTMARFDCYGKRFDFNGTYVNGKLFDNENIVCSLL